MRSMRTHRKLELKKKFIGGESFAVARAPELAAYLAELGGPVSEEQRAARVVQGRIGDSLRPVEAGADKPAPRELVIPGKIVSERFLHRAHANLGREIRTYRGARPDELAAGQERVIDRAAERLPSQRGVHSVQLVRAIAPETVPAGVGCSQAEIGSLVEISVGAQVPDGRKVIAALGTEHALAVAAEKLRGGFQEQALRRRHDPADRESRVA